MDSQRIRVPETAVITRLSHHVCTLYAKFWASRVTVRTFSVAKSAKSKISNSQSFGSSRETSLGVTPLWSVLALMPGIGRKITPEA